MANPLQILRSSTSGSKPSSLLAGQLAINQADGILYWADDSGVVKSTDLRCAPAGLVAPFAMSSAPPGWLKANGAAVSRTAYSALFAAIGTTYGSGNGSTTFNLPDGRANAIRGYDDGRGVDSGRVFGSEQLDALQGHFHTFNPNNVRGASGATAGVGSAGNLGNDSAASATVSAPTTDGTNGTPRTAAETRMRNLALLICVKY